MVETAIPTRVREAINCAEVVSQLSYEKQQAATMKTTEIVTTIGVVRQYPATTPKKIVTRSFNTTWLLLHSY